MGGGCLDGESRGHTLWKTLNYSIDIIWIWWPQGKRWMKFRPTGTEKCDFNVIYFELVTCPTHNVSTCQHHEFIKYINAWGKIRLKSLGVHYVCYVYQWPSYSMDQHVLHVGLFEAGNLQMTVYLMDQQRLQCHLWQVRPEAIVLFCMHYHAKQPFTYSALMTYARPVNVFTSYPQSPSFGLLSVYHCASPLGRCTGNDVSSGSGSAW